MLTQVSSVHGGTTIGCHPPTTAIVVELVDTTYGARLWHKFAIDICIVHYAYGLENTAFDHNKKQGPVDSMKATEMPPPLGVAHRALLVLIS